MTTKSINAAELKEQCSEVLNRVSHHRERFIITRRDNSIAAIIPVEDLELLLESQDRHDLAAATESLKQARELGYETLDSFKEKIG